ncbi:MAG: FAD/NAD(P)-binding protein [Sphingomonadaceae bacterium]
MPMATKKVVIIGGGFSGTLTAINLLRHDGPDAVLIERAPQAGRGTAYSAAHPDHLLNVRAGNMSAYPDDPGHFARWLAARTGDCAATFAPRIVYGDYLAEELGHAIAAAPQRLRLVRDTALALETGDTGVAVTLASGGTVTADVAVLAMGNLPPHAPAPLDPVALGDDLYRGDPWAGDIGEGLGPDDSVLLLGTGLTMVDAALLLAARGFTGRIIAMSRRGLLPRMHDAAQPPVIPLDDRPPTALSPLVRAVREAADAIGWRNAVDRLRPFTQSLWCAASPQEQARFLRHMRPWWDVHRHRIAPSVAARLDAMRADGRLTALAAKPVAYQPEARSVAVDWRGRGSDTVSTLHVRRIVNCTGPQGDLARSSEPLLQGLVADGHARADICRLGLDVDRAGNLIGRNGIPNPALFALGPMTRGAFWEINAVPDIRVQVWAVARKLANAHWVGGEGL